MRRTLAILLFAGAMLSGLAFAQLPLAIELNDSAIDYDDTGIDNAYVHLALENGHLVVSLNSVHTASALPEKIDFHVPSLNDSDEVVTLSNIRDLEYEPMGRNLRSLEITHPTGVLKDVINAYASAFGNIGFRMTNETGTFNVKSMVFENGEGRVGLKLVRHGDAVTATLKGLEPL